MPALNGVRPKTTAKFLDLRFAFAGPTGSTLLLDDTAFAGITSGDFASANLSGWAARLPNGAGTVGTTAQLASQTLESSCIALLSLGLLAFAGRPRRALA